MIRRPKRIVLYFPQSVPDADPVRYGMDNLPLSLLTIAAWPLADGYEVVLIDGNLHPQAEAHRRVVEACEGALLYGTSGILGYQVADAYLCTQAVRARHPRLTAVIGGWFASTAPELQLATGLYDAVALGQGELTFRELVRAVEAGEPLDGIAGLALRRDGEVLRTAPRAVAGWSQLADPPWHLVEFERYRERQIAQRRGRETESLPRPPDARSPRRARPWFGISYYSSFGCPLGCTFCCSPEVTGQRWKAMPAARMLDDLQALQERCGFDVVRFYDANWAVMEKRVREFALGVLERGMRFYYYPYLQAESIVRAAPTTIDLFAESGMFVAHMGAETGTDETMAAIQKTTRGDHNLEAACALEQRGILPHLSYVIGFPGETAESMLATLDQARRVQVACPRSHPIVWPYRPIPGTPAYREALEQGYRPPESLLGWGTIGDYRIDETWKGRIPPEVARARKLLHHFATLSRRDTRGRPGWWERRAKRRLADCDWRLARLEARAFDVYERLRRRVRPVLGGA